MRTAFIFLLGNIFFLSNNCFSQAQTKPTNAWQQTVNYTISCQLDDENNSLTNGQIRIEYINNSPDTLSYIYMHLWPNAYSNGKTAFAKQKLEDGDTKFYYLEPSKRGNIDSLDFTANGLKVNLNLDATNPDIGKITLLRPLYPHDTLILASPFTVKIPESVSRLGHVGQSYQITQWYPKPAVYDSEGWHPFPYLDQGEFYSEYGSFDVTISLPSNYVVAATGELQNAEEWKFLAQKVAATKAIEKFDTTTNFPPSESTFKTLHYVQNNVHDFAWFADKRFHVLNDEITLSDGNTVKCWAMFTNTEANLWKNAAEYVRDGVGFYSNNIGNYPYKHCTAVQSALSAGAGMEYPMITVIGISRTAKTLERVIVHEVGHNWFYGQLGSNERQHPWMDEGINSYYEDRYFEEKYPNNNSLGEMMGIPNRIGRMIGIEDLEYNYLNQFLYYYKAQKNEDQAIELPAEQYQPTNYGGIVYMKTASVLKYLEKYLGKKKFDQAMQQYYTDFEFKHPTPADFRAEMENSTKKNLDWFFDRQINTAQKIDYKIKKVEKDADVIGDDRFDIITLKNAQHRINGPFTLAAFNDTTLVKRIWYDGFNGTMPVHFPHSDYDKLVLDDQHLLFDINRHNNYYYPNALCKKHKFPRIKAFGGLPAADRGSLYFTLIAGYNIYDGWMAGLSFYNQILPNAPIEYTLSLLYGFQSKAPAGIGHITYTHLPKNEHSRLLKWQLRLDGSTFSFGENRRGFFGETPYEINSVQYYRLVPSLQFYLKPPTPRTKVERKFVWRNLWLKNTEVNTAVENPAEQYSTLPFNYIGEQFVSEISYEYTNSRVLKPYGYKLALQYEPKAEMLLATTNINHTFTYARKRKIDLRFFGGYFLQNNSAEKLPNNNSRQLDFSGLGRTDFWYDDLYFGRNDIENFAKRQVTNRTGGFNTDIPIGVNDQYVFSIGFVSDLPVGPRLPLKLYGNYGWYPKDFNDDTTLAEAGVSVSLFNENVQLHFPIVTSSNIKNSYSTNSRNSFFQRMSFEVNLRALDPISMAREKVNF
ncbi:MAG: M1 family metallopeptidase [Chitinophagales bacterium]|nr:M1 family metallopeptidase [Bacteroidota bacterium]MCB9042459.1 M1 family metallopeptidase [Chitinophagales bacterium]